MPSSPKMSQTKPFDEEKPSTLENAISVVLGLAVVLVIGAMIVNTIRNRNKQPESQNTAAQTQQEQSSGPTGTNKNYTVQPGDTLWSIAEKEYNNGFVWAEIKKANNLSSDTIENGQQLVIPDLESTKATGVASQGSTGPTGGQTDLALETKSGQTLSTSTDKTYTVVRGDCLWNIAVSRYNNGFRWVDIAKANNLQNPNLIHAGNVLTLP